MNKIWELLDERYSDIIKFAKEFTTLDEQFYKFLEEIKNKKEDTRALYDCIFMIWDEAPDIVDIQSQKGFLNICDLMDEIEETGE